MVKKLEMQLEHSVAIISKFQKQEQSSSKKKKNKKKKKGQQNMEDDDDLLDSMIAENKKLIEE